MRYFPKLSAGALRVAVLPMALGLSVLAMPALADQKAVITVTGEANVAVVPDMAQLAIGVEAKGETAAAALSANSAQMAEVLTRLETAGITGGDVQTNGLAVMREGGRVNAAGEELPGGYLAQNMVNVTLRDLDALGGLIDQLVADGANTLNGLSFAVAEPRALVDQARAAAVEDARARAVILAEAAGVSLGRVLSITEGGGYGGPAPRMMRAEASSVPIARGEVSYGANVTITWELAE